MKRTLLSCALVSLLALCAGRLLGAPQSKLSPPTSTAWKKIFEQGKIEFYLDPALIEQKGLYVSIPYLVDLPVKNELTLLTDGRLSYLSVVSVVNYDCSRRSLPPRSERYWQSAENYFYSGAHATGAVLTDPARRREPEWISGSDGLGIVYEGAVGQVSQSYFVTKVLDPELKICKNLWQAPADFQPEKTPPYVQVKISQCGPTNPTVVSFTACEIMTRQKPISTFKDQNQMFATPGTFTGKATNGIPNGYGRYQIDGGVTAGDLYVGFFALGNFEGFGSYYHRADTPAKGAVFVGFFKNHKKSGPGAYRLADGSIVQEGIWADDKLVQPGRTMLIDTLRGLPFCEGSDATRWSECFGYLEFEPIQGQRLQRAGTPIYAGSFKDGLPDGVGTFFSADGRVGYQGQLKAAKPDGIGTEFYDSSGERFYSGGFLDGKPHGQGVSLTGGGRRLLERY